MGTASACAGGGGALRSRHWKPLPPRHEAAALASGQVAEAMHLRTIAPGTAALDARCRRACAMSDPFFHGVRLSHPEKVLYSEQGTTKRALAEYYEAVANVMLPHVVNRPISL